MDAACVLVGFLLFLMPIVILATMVHISVQSNMIPLHSVDPNSPGFAAFVGVSLFAIFMICSVFSAMGCCNQGAPDRDRHFVAVGRDDNDDDAAGVFTLPPPPPAVVPRRRRSRRAAAVASEHKCVICMDARYNCLLVPCNHLCLCFECACNWVKRANSDGVAVKCPVCMRASTHMRQVYMA